MPPKRFLVYLCESIDKAKIRRMAELMELNEQEMLLLLVRFCDGLSVDQTADLHNISIAQQRTMVPKLEAKIMNWIVQHFEFFHDREVRMLNRWIPSE